jgi:N-acetylglucosamine-6-phosphate deacetylase
MAHYRGVTIAGEPVEVSVDGTKIVSVQPIPAAANLPLIAPPLVDLQQNGALGLSFNGAHEHPEVLDVVADHALRHGVGRILATVTTQALQDSIESLRVMASRLDSDARLARIYPGFHFEGNYLSREFGWRGAHAAEYMRNPEWREWQALDAAADGRIRIFNIDPSLPHAMETIRQAAAKGFVVSMAHCGPDADTIHAAVNAGARMVTHLGNGAPPTIHRHHNPFWSWLAEPRLNIGLIADGFHLPGDFLLAAIAAKGRDQAFLVSDSAHTAGLPPGRYQDREIEEGGLTHVLDNREILAGAWHQADRCVERMCELGWSLADAWRQQSVVPAAIAQLELPRIEAGEDAEFAISRWTEEGLRLEQVVFLGEELLREPVHPRMA